MKHIILFLAIIFSTPLFVFSQTNQGNFLFGGTITFASASGDEDDIDINGANISINDFEQTISETRADIFGGTFFVDNIAGLINIAYLVESTETKNGGTKEKEETTTYIISPTVRYYINDLFFNVGYGFGKVIIDASSYSSSYYSSGTDSYEQEAGLREFKIGAGYSIWLGDIVAITPILDYRILTIKQEDLDGVSSVFWGYDIYGNPIYQYQAVQYDRDDTRRGFKLGIGINIHL